MSNLRVAIDRKSRTAKFTGGGTFQAKELIKELGRAKFLGADKVWEVSQFEASSEELQTLFPGILIVEGEQSVAVETPAAETKATNVPNGLSVSQFLGRVRGVLRSAFPGTVCIYGVLTEVDFSSGGRVFLELKESAESDERVRCVIWQDADRVCEGLKKAGFALERDLQIMFEVSVQLSKKGAYLSLSIERIIVEYTLGKIAALREQTNERLKKEGLFGKNKELELPFLPRRLGIITSAGGTVINDFMASLEVAQFGFELLWQNVSVQGVDAKRSILSALALFGTMENIDAILIFRGGGGQAELAIFNDYEIAKAVCLCPFPVISAIGHEEDMSSVQDVSFRALGVPKDIGRFFADLIIDFRLRFQKAAELVVSLATYKFDTSSERMMTCARTIAKFLQQSLTHLEQSLRKTETSLPPMVSAHLEARARRFIDLATPLSFLGTQVVELVHAAFRGAQRQLLERATYLVDKKTAEVTRVSRLQREIELILDRKSENIASFEQLLVAVSPEMQLKRGFALIRSTQDKKIITNGAGIPAGEQLTIEFQDCQRAATILAKE